MSPNLKDELIEMLSRSRKSITRMKRLQYDDEICDDYPIVIPAKRSVQCRKITDAVYWYYSLLYHVKQISDYGGRSSLALRMTQRTSRKKLFVVISRKDEGFLIEKFEVS